MLRGTVLTLGIFSILMCLAACGRGEKDAKEPSSAAPAVPEHAVEYQGKYYLPREDLQTILIMGLD